MAGTMHRWFPLFLMGMTAWAQNDVSAARVRRVLDQAVVLDLHDDTTQMMVDEGYELSERHDYGQVDIPRMREGQVTGVFLSIWTDAGRIHAHRIHPARAGSDRRGAARSGAHPGWRWPRRPTRCWRRKSAGQIAILMGVEGGQTIDSDLAVLRIYFDLGVRYMTLTHTENTPWADTSSRQPEHNGLTDFGRAGGAGDEPAGDDGGHLARFRQDVL